MMNKTKEIMSEINRVIMGKEDVIKKILMTILSEGHVLLEDVPGVGKTTMALAFSKALGLNYRRLQFTPDVMPSDVVGFYYFNKEKNEFVYRDGAVMTNLLLADEINRTSSRTQSALLEVMEEGQVTVDGICHKVPAPFFVIATQNPVGSAGTQTLPESQLDRFMVKLSMGYPDLEAEIGLMSDRSTGNPLDEVKQILSMEELLMLQKEVSEIYVSPLIYRYIAMLSAATRKHELIVLGISPRGSLALCKMAKASAYMAGRDYVTPEDVRYCVGDVFRHRLVLKSRVRLTAQNVEKIINDICETVPVPEREPSEKAKMSHKTLRRRTE